MADTKEVHRDSIISVTDPRGYTVYDSGDQYESHIIRESHHTEIPIDDIVEGVKNPEAIYESSHHKDRDIYFSKTSSTYPSTFVKTVVSFDQERGHTEGHVVTAFISKHIEGGISEYPKYIKPKL